MLCIDLFMCVINTSSVTTLVLFLLIFLNGLLLLYNYLFIIIIFLLYNIISIGKSHS